MFIKVADPKKEGTGFSAKTTYLITTTIPIQSLSTKNALELQTFTIRRRYSEFLKSHQRWKQLHPILPPLPPKTKLKRFADNTVQKRVEAFNNILKKALQIPALRDSSEFQEFLGIQQSLVTEGKENEPWYYDSESLEGCTTDQDLDRICQNYRKNKPDLADVLEGMGRLALKCRHLGQLLKLMEDGTEEERRHLVQWAALRLDDLKENPTGKEEIVKHVFYSEKQGIEHILDRALKIQENHSAERKSSNNQGNVLLNNLEDNNVTEDGNSNASHSMKIPKKSNQIADRASPNSTGSTYSSYGDSLENDPGSLIGELPSRVGRRPPPPIPSTDSSLKISTPKPVVGRTAQASSTIYSLASPPKRPQTPPPNRDSVTSDFLQFIQSMRDGTSSSTLTKIADSMPQVMFMQLFSALQSEPSLEEKLKKVKDSMKLVSGMKCQQLQFLLGSFSSDDERKLILPLIKVSDPDNYTEIKGYSDEFTLFAQKYIRNQS